jgi:hypothetical protein
VLGAFLLLAVITFIAGGVIGATASGIAAAVTHKTILPEMGKGFIAGGTASLSSLPGGLLGVIIGSVVYASVYGVLSGENFQQIFSDAVFSVLLGVTGYAIGFVFNASFPATSTFITDSVKNALNSVKISNIGIYKWIVFSRFSLKNWSAFKSHYYGNYPASSHSTALIAGGGSALPVSAGANLALPVSASANLALPGPTLTSALYLPVISGNYIVFNKSHKTAQPQPRGLGPNGGKLESHHGIQRKWAENNLNLYGYDDMLAPTVTIETGTGLPHTIINNAQKARQRLRIKSGLGAWSSSPQDELGYIVKDFRKAGFTDTEISGVLKQQYDMFDKLGVPYKRLKGW